MVSPSEASGGNDGSPDTNKAINTKKIIRYKRQYYYPNHPYVFPRYMNRPVTQNFYRLPQPHTYEQPHRYENFHHKPFYHEPADPEKPRVHVHIEAEKKNVISHTEDNLTEDRKKRQLLGMTSLMSPVQPIKSPLRQSTVKTENAKSEVPKQRSSRDVPIEVPARAEEHHGVFQTKTTIMTEGETKKSTIQKIQKRETNSQDDEEEHAPIRKRQFVFNSEPPVVRATVKGENQNREEGHSPIGKLIKMIAGRNAKNILGLNSKGFDVFPGPLPDAKESAWNIKSAEAGNTEQPADRYANQLPQEQPQSVPDMYQQAGLEINAASQRRAEAAKNAEKEAEEERAAFVTKENEAIAAQTAASLQEQKLEQEKDLEKQQEILQEQELAHERANTLTNMLSKQARQQFVDMSRVFPQGEQIARPMPAMMMPEMPYQDDNDDREELPAPTRMMPMPFEDFRPTQMQLPTEAMSYQDEQPMPLMPLMQPTPTPFFPTPPMMFMPTTAMFPLPDPTAPFFQDPDRIERPETSEVSDAPLSMPHFKPHFARMHPRLHMHRPTEMPYRFSEYPEPEYNEDAAKPEVHVHIQTEKSKIPQGEKGRNHIAQEKTIEGIFLDRLIVGYRRY